MICTQVLPGFEEALWLSGGFNAAPPLTPRSATDEGKDYQDVICLGRKGGQSLKGEGP